MFRLIISSDDNLIGCKFDENKDVVQARIKETVKEDVGKFGTKEIEQIRVLYPGSWEVYRKDDNGECALYDSGKSPLDKITLAPVFFGRKLSLFTAKPPLLGLAELNHQHWVSSSDQNNILHVCRVPILFGKCLEDDENGQVIVSPRNLIHSKDQDGDLRYVEHSGQAIGAGWKDLERLEMLMGLWGLELLSDARSGGVTATEKVLTGAKTGSFLNACALAFQDCLNTALGFTAEILQAGRVGQALVNTDFSLALKNFDTGVLLKGYEIGLLDRTTVIDELKRRGVVGDNVDPVNVAEMVRRDQGSAGSFGSLGKSFFSGLTS